MEKNEENSFRIGYDAFITLEKKSDLTYFVFIHSLETINIEGEVTDSKVRA